MCHLPDPNSENSSQRHRNSSPVAAWSAIAIILTTALASAVAFSYSSQPKSPAKSLEKNKIDFYKQKNANHFNKFVNTNPIPPSTNNSVINNKNIIRRIPVKPSPIFVRNEPNSSLNSSLSVPENNNLETPVSAAPSPSPIPRSTLTVIHQEAKENNNQTASIGEKSLHQHLPVTTFSNELKADRQASALQVNSSKQIISSTAKRRLELSLPDVVALTLQNSRDLKNAYLERIAQQADLEVAESKFKPTLRPNVQIYLDRAESGEISRSVGNAQSAATVNLKLPTGADINFGWQAYTQNSATSIVTNDDIRQNVVFQFNQPLLRGGGIALNRATIDIARAREQINILNLKRTLIERIYSAISAYRALLQAQAELKIVELSLVNANNFLEVVRALIEAGRKARVDILQTQSDIANRQVNLVEARNRLETAKIALLKILDIPEEDIDIVVLEENLTVKPRELNLGNLQEIALANRPEYLQAQLQFDITKFDRLIAENDRLWNLDFFANYDNQVDNIQQLSTGLRLSRILGDRNSKAQLVRSRVNFQQAENEIQELRQTIELEVIDEVKNVNSAYEQVKLAQTARELAERQLEIEIERLRLGKQEVFQIVNFQEALETARNRELQANIDYLNALTSLDRTVGTTLQTWQVTVEPRKP